MRAGTGADRREASILAKAERHGPRRAVIDSSREWSYDQLLDKASGLAGRLQARRRRGSNPMVLVLTEPGGAYVVATFAAWGSSLCSVPLCAAHTVREMVYYATDCGASVILHDAANAARAAELCELVPALTPIDVETAAAGGEQPPEDACFTVSPPADAAALLIYTSGTTGNPKGALHTHASVENQVHTLVAAWECAETDHSVNCLPLHHVHGLVNLLLCSLAAGATCEFFSLKGGRDAYAELHRKFADPSGPNVFQAVPTIYTKILAYHATLPEQARADWRRAVSARFRLMVSGSMALPAATHTAWEQASGVALLERYGMTEVGMALSEEIHGSRTVGFVGVPLPGVVVRLRPLPDGADDRREAGETERFSAVGELLIKSPSLFKEYWNRAEATAEAFTPDGFFVTGDCVGCTSDGQYAILGRISVDIMKSAGYKLSALEIESVLLESPLIAEAAVLGVPDDTFGEVVSALIVPSAAAKGELAESAVLDHCATRLAKYKTPRRFLFLDALPRNAMGKVNKKQLVKLFA
ncbi:Malonate--CoA ligase [Diplonema papillatum]|nr:Malonate--CoA ligase [Diplonema papillatum]